MCKTGILLLIYNSIFFLNMSRARKCPAIRLSILQKNTRIPTRISFFQYSVFIGRSSQTWLCGRFFFQHVSFCPSCSSTVHGQRHAYCNAALQKYSVLKAHRFSRGVKERGLLSYMESHSQKSNLSYSLYIK